jgi:tetratricopeptide (TPR) repeat protein
LGNALAERGELKEAIDQFNQAVGLAPELAEAHESLARALALQGKRDEAVQHYQHALRILQSRRTGQAE